MRTLLCLAFVCVLFVGAGCDGNSNPSTIHDTVWVIDSGLGRAYPLHGKVTTHSNCDQESNHSGVTITIVATGESTVTDDSGYFSFPRYTRPRSGNDPGLRFSRPGFYEASPQWYEVNLNLDSGFYFVRQKLFRHINYSAALVDEPVVDSTQYYLTRDTIVLDENDVLVKKKLIVDSTFAYYFYFSAVGLNELDQKIAFAQVIPLISRTETFDHLDLSKLLLVGGGAIGPPYTLIISNDQLLQSGFSRGDTIYVSFTSTGECMEGYSPGLRKLTPIPVIVR